MHRNPNFKILVVIFLVLCVTGGAKMKSVNNKMKRRIVDLGDVQHNILSDNRNNLTDKETERGFFPYGGILSLGKVLNFLPVGGERECQPSEYTVARAGICLNPYDCRQRDGKSAGDCAHGLGVCCIFEVSCGGIVQNNLTYFMSPGFPELFSGERDCNVTIEKTHAGIMQLRIDFVHFTIGQPNRMTGECDEDAMTLGEGANNFTVCGQNHGQHAYYTLPSGSETRDLDELPSSKSTTLSIRLRGGDMPRVWLLRLAQMPLAYSAPHNCLQYYTADNGTIKSFNYASNGRYLANHEYRSCVRHNTKRCSIRYSPCDAKSFRIGTSQDYPVLGSGPGAYGGAGTGFYGPDGSLIPIYTTSTTPSTTTSQVEQQNVTNAVNQDQLMPVNDPVQEDEVEGSGADPSISGNIVQSTPQPSLVSRIWSYIWPSWMWGQDRSWGWRWSPYSQHYGLEDFPYGSYGLALRGYGRQRCRDRVTVPCENEYFVSSSSTGAGVCDPHHCGNNFCPGLRFDECRIETSITPFAVSFHFGPPSYKSSPEDNLGVCLRYTQMLCDG